MKTSQIWDLLRSFEPPRNNPGLLLWKDALRMGQGAPTFALGELLLGEETISREWERVPVGISLRVVMMQQGQNRWLRWGDSSRMKDFLAGNYHDHLLPDGDAFESTKSGWLTVVHPGVLKFNS